MQLNSNFCRYRSLMLGVLLVSLVACQADYSGAGNVNTGTEASTDPAPAIAQPDRARRPQLQPPVRSREQGTEQEIVFADLWDRIRIGLVLQEHYDHPDVVAQLNDFADNQAYFDLITERASPFLYAIVEELERRELPLELAFLPFVESAFDPNAYSPDHAVGLWQFMRATAASMGLQLDWWYDARRDPKTSTVAALDYLEELNRQFEGDWLLALAAYNAGDGNVRRAISRNKKRNLGNQFWELPLPGETRSHVPRILALASLVSQVDDFPVELTPIANEEPLTIIEVGTQIDLAQAARLAEMDYEALRALNPGYLQWATHPKQPQHIALPHQQAEYLKTALASVPADQLLTWDQYKILPGDTLGGIAAKMQTQVDVLRRANGLRGSQIIAGDTLIIPRGLAANNIGTPPQINGDDTQVIKVPASYQVRSGDNLWLIARRFDLKSMDIASWNNLQVNSILKPGQILDLSMANSQASTGSSSSTNLTSSYLVRPGDTMARIAARNKVKLEDLLKWNNMSADALIFPGQSLQIQSPENRLN